MHLVAEMQTIQNHKNSAERMKRGVVYRMHNVVKAGRTVVPRMPTNALT